MKRQKTTLKSYFETGDRPTQSQYENLIDSLRHVNDTIPLTDIDGQIALKDQINAFGQEQSFLNIYVGGNATFDDETSFNAQVEFTDHTIFESSTEFHNELNVQLPLTTFDVANQPSGSIVLTNNSTGGEAPTIGGKSNSNSPGLQFIASTRDTTGTIADVLFSVRESDNTDFTAELDTVAFQFRRYGTPLMNIYRNGRQENLFGLDVQGTATFNSSVVLNDALTVSNGGIEIYGTSSFEDSLELNGSLNANSGINSNWHIKLKNNAWLWSQYSPTHDELRLNANTAGGWDFYNQTQSEFANIRANGAEFSGLITANTGIIVDGEGSTFNSTVIINDELQTNGTIIHTGTASFTGASIFNGSITAQEVTAEHQTGYAVLDLKADSTNSGSGGVPQVRYHLGGTQYVRQGINVSGDYELRMGTGGGTLLYKLTQSDTAHEFLSAVRLRGTTSMYGIAETDRRLTFNGNIADTYNIYYYDEGDNAFHTIEIGGNSATGTGLQILNNGDIQTNGSINFPYSGTNNLYINQDNGAIGYGKMIPFSNSGKFEFDTHYTGNGSYEWQYNSVPIMHLYSNGNLKPTGSYVSSDGTLGYNGSFIVGAYDITVKDGIITDVVNIS